ncbi:MAG: TolC family protein [Saprospiraceae bacterium]|nr:TolC family protein [Saprospiraceae bacterium]
MKNQLVFICSQIFFLVSGYPKIFSQEFLPMVQIAWENNHLLKAKHFQLNSASFALQEAKALYGPSVMFATQYTLAEGGRSIDFPVGDLLNPVYGTLNQLTNSTVFPQINNVNTQLLPNNFYDARFRISQPIYYPDLVINKKLKTESLYLKELEIKAFKRQISKDVMLAYFQSITSKNVIDIYLATDTLLSEAKRTTQSMIRNGTSLPSSLSRIETQIAAIEAQKIEASSNHRNALRYLQFTLGVKDSSVWHIELPEVPDISNSNILQREEVAQINQGIKMLHLANEKEDQFYLPKIGAQLDFGSQAFDFGFDPYILVGLNLEINIYDNKKHKYRKEAIKSDIQASEAQKNEIEEQMNLMISVAAENLRSAIAQAKTYRTRINAVSKIYNEVFRKYKEGSANYLELMDAQSQVTQVNLQFVIAQNNAWVKWAEYVYVTAAFPIN